MILKSLGPIMQEFGPTRGIEVQTGEDDEAYFQVLFEISDTWFEVACYPEGNWYEVESVLSGINQALEYLGDERRLFPLINESQAALVVFEEPRKVKTFVGAMDMVIDEDGNYAQERGKAFEAMIRKKLELKEFDPLPTKD